MHKKEVSELKKMQSKSAKARALSKMKDRVGTGKSRLSGKSYKHD